MGSGFSSATSRKQRPKRESQAESSRVLFLLYLIHRTWNVVVEHVDSKSARWRGSHTVPSSGEAGRRFDSASLADSDLGSCYSSCSCSYCRLRECAQDCVRYGPGTSYCIVRKKQIWHLFRNNTFRIKLQFSCPLRDLWSREG